MATFRTKRNDTKKIRGFLEDGNGDPVTLSGATVVFNMTGPGGKSDLVVNRGSCTVEDATTAEVSYTFAASETALAGTYKGEFEVTYSNAEVETFPDSGAITILIDGDLG